MNRTTVEQTLVVQGDELPSFPNTWMRVWSCRSEISPHGFLFFCFFFKTRAEKGIKLVQEGQYAQAVALFTEAIRCDPEDYRYNNCKGD